MRKMPRPPSWGIFHIFSWEGILLGTPMEGVCDQAAECNGCCIAPHLLPEAWVREIGGIDGDSPAVEKWGFSAKMPFEHAHKGWWQQGP